MVKDRKLELASLVLAGLASEARQQARCSRQRLYQYVDRIKTQLGGAAVAEIQHRARLEAAKAIYRELSRLVSPQSSQRRKARGASARGTACAKEEVAP